MLCGLFCALRVLTYGPVHKLMAKDTEGEQKMDEYYQVVQTPVSYTHLRAHET